MIAVDPVAVWPLLGYESLVCCKVDCVHYRSALVASFAAKDLLRWIALAVFGVGVADDGGENPIHAGRTLEAKQMPVDYSQRLALRVSDCLGRFVFNLLFPFG